MKNGQGKEYNYYGKLKFEGEYLNGLKNGKVREYDDNCGSIDKWKDNMTYIKYHQMKFWLKDINIEIELVYVIFN